jgi:hypothetical protein
MTSAVPLLTLVTGFWDPVALGRDAGWRPAEHYLGWFAELHRQVPWPIVVWIDPAWADAVAEIVAHPGPAARRLVPRRFEDLPRANDRDALSRLRPFDNHNAPKDTLEFHIAIWAKPDLVVDASRLGGQDSARWAWIDFGVAHVADPGEVDWHAVASAAPERVRLCTMRETAPGELTDLDEFYRVNRGKVAAGFFTGDAAAMHDLRARFHAEFERMRATGRRATDEQVLAALQARAPGVFERWYADYASILCNYTGICRDVATVFGALADCRARGLCRSGVDIVRRLLEALDAQQLTLAPGHLAVLLHEAYICAYYVDRSLAERFGLTLAGLHRHGRPDFRGALDTSLVEANLRHVAIDLAHPPWTLSDLLAQPDAARWLPCL